MTKLNATTVKGQLEEIEYIKKVREFASKVSTIKTAMLNTLNTDNRIVCEPMRVFPIEDDGIIWMFSMKDSRKVENIKANNKVTVTYLHPESNLYLSVNGEASIVNDNLKVEQLWEESFKAWFPYGKSDPNLCLIKITPEEAEYWDAPDILVSQIVSLVKNTIAGKPYVEGENNVIDFKP